MSEALLVGFTPNDESRWRMILAKSNLRAKSSVNCEHALHWIERREFVIALISDGIQLEDQQRLADAIWSRQPLTPVVLIDSLESSIETHEQSKLHGLTVLSSGDIEIQLEQIVHAVVERRVASISSHVLVVEDLDSPRDIICSFIESLGLWRATGVNSAAVALNELAKDPTRFCCVVTDIRMPDISGAQMIQQIQLRNDLRHLPVVALTAHGTLDCLVDCLKAGASGFLVKPPKRKDLQRELERAARLTANKQPARLVSSIEAERLRKYLSQNGLLE